MLTFHSVTRFHSIIPTSHSMISASHSVIPAKAGIQGRLWGVTNEHPNPTTPGFPLPRE